MDDYDCGLINDWGGGNVDWWQDYIRAEIGRANEHWRMQIAALTPASDGRAEGLREAADDLYVVICEEGHDCPEGPGGACCGQPSANPIAAIAQAVGDLGDDLTYLPDAARFNLHLKAYRLARKLWAISARAAEREGGSHE